MWHCSSSLNCKAQWKCGASLTHESDATIECVWRAATASAAAQAAAFAPGPSGGAASEAAWAQEASAAVETLRSSDCGGVGRGTELVGRAWQILAPRCRRFACEELRRLLSVEAKQREALRRQQQQMAPALLLRAPPPSLNQAVPVENHSLPGLFLVTDVTRAGISNRVAADCTRPVATEDAPSSPSW